MNNNLIYILDKDTIKGNILQYHLNSKGFKNTVMYRTQDDCIYSLQKNHKPDFILADSSLSGMSDLEFVQLVKTSFPQIRIIIFSEDEDPDHAERLFESGVTDYILRRGEKSKWIHELISNLQYILKEETPVLGIHSSG